MKRLNPGWLPILALVAASCIWASSFIALKFAFRTLDPVLVIFGRMLVASICFLPVLRDIKRLPYRKGDWKALGFMAFSEPCLYFVFESLALKNTDASQAGMIVSMLPLLVAVAAHFLLKERISRRTLAGFSLAIAGAVWLSAVAQPTVASPNPVLGNFFEFLAMVCATGYMVALKSLTPRYTPWFLTAVQAFCGTLFFLPPLFTPLATLPASLDIGALLAVLYLGVVVTVGAYGLYNYGMSRIPANQASAFVNLIPVLTLFMGFLLLDERLSLSQYLASALVLCGVVLSQDRRTA